MSLMLPLVNHVQNGMAVAWFQFVLSHRKFCLCSLASRLKVKTDHERHKITETIIDLLVRWNSRLWEAGTLLAQGPAQSKIIWTVFL